MRQGTIVSKVLSISGTDLFKVEANEAHSFLLHFKSKEPYSRQRDIIYKYKVVRNPYENYIFRGTHTASNRQVASLYYPILKFKSFSYNRYYYSKSLNSFYIINKEKKNLFAYQPERFINNEASTYSDERDKTLLSPLPNTSLEKKENN